MFFEEPVPILGVFFVESWIAALVLGECKLEFKV